MNTEQVCPNCKETDLDNCGCIRNKCIKCGEPVGNITFTVCDKCWNIDKSMNTDKLKEIRDKHEIIIDEVISEIREWVKDNKDNIPIDGDYCNLVYLDDDTESLGLLTKLNQLKETK